MRPLGRSVHHPFQVPTRDPFARRPRAASRDGRPASYGDSSCADQGTGRVARRTRRGRARDWFAAGSAISGQVEANSSQPGYKRLLHAGSTCPFCNYGMRLIGHYPSTSVEVWACSWCRYHQEQPCLELNEDSAPPLR